MGSGKSTAASFFKSKGAFIVDADEEAKKLITLSDVLKSSIVNEFGENVILKGKIDFNNLSQIAFSSPLRQQKLNSLIWPLVGDMINKKLKEAEKKDYSLFIVDAALLMEANFESFFDSILLITAESTIRIQRVAMRKNIPEKQIEQRISLQIPESEKEKRADFIIWNNDDRKCLLRNLNIFYNKLHL